ncbi:hypothetical protein MKEN_01373300 [Mycena kentingensis (nom. inval.)]|nr:hypothetical protein MKEN_01373300 [Mycena kentingensis (nom. inval.)]
MGLRVIVLLPLLLLFANVVRCAPIPIPTPLTGPEEASIKLTEAVSNLNLIDASNISWTVNGNNSGWTIDGDNNAWTVDGNNSVWSARVAATDMSVSVKGTGTGPGPTRIVVSSSPREPGCERFGC